MLNAKQKKVLSSWGISIVDGAVKVDSKKLFGIDEKTLLEAEKDAAESTIEISAKPEGFTILDDEGLKGFESRVKADAKPEMEKAIKEILAKVWKEKHGVKLDTKDPDEVLEAIVLAKSTAAVEAAKLTVDEQVKLKETDLTKLRENYTALEKERDLAKADVERSKNELNEYKDTTEFGSLVAGKFTNLLKPSEIRARLREEEGIEIKRVNGVWKALDASGEPIKNKLRVESPVSEVIKDVLERRKEWAAAVAGGNEGGGAGRGNGTGSSGSGGNEGGNGKGTPANPASIKNMSGFKEYAAQNRKEWGLGLKGANREQMELNKIVAENKEFDYNS